MLKSRITLFGANFRKLECIMNLQRNLHFYQRLSLCAKCTNVYLQNQIFSKHIAYLLQRSSYSAVRIMGKHSETLSCAKNVTHSHVKLSRQILTPTSGILQPQLACPPPHSHFLDSSQRSLQSMKPLRESCKLSSQPHHQHVRQQGTFQPVKEEATKFSTTKLILDSSPHSLQPYLRLIRFDKPIGTWLLYWPCTWSIALAAQPGCMPDWKMLGLFGAGAFFMRGAGCIINDMWDKDFDKQVARTKSRPLASGEITYFQALVFLGTQLSCALAILLQLNNYSIVLGAASMGLVIVYPLCKRFTYWPQIMLGLTLNWGVLLTWTALRGSLELPGLILYLACTLYTIVYDTVYSHQDKYDDMLIGVKSTAIRLGDQTKPWMVGFISAMTGGLTASGLLCDMTWPYFAAVGITSSRLLYQIYKVHLDNPEDCAKAFRGNFYLGAIMFLGIIFSNLLKQKEDAKQSSEEVTAKSTDQ